MQIQAGDKLTIRRGKLKGEAGEVIAYQADPAAYVLKMADGTFSVQNVKNVIEPAETTITQSELAGLIATNYESGMEALIHDLDSKYPGFTAKLGFKVE
jgi:ribosomal protein L24